CVPAGALAGNTHFARHNDAGKEQIAGLCCKNPRSPAAAPKGSGLGQGCPDSGGDTSAVRSSAPQLNETPRLAPICPRPEGFLDGLFVLQGGSKGFPEIELLGTRV